MNSIKMLIWVHTQNVAENFTVVSHLGGKKKTLFRHLLQVGKTSCQHLFLWIKIFFTIFSRNSKKRSCHHVPLLSKSIKDATVTRVFLFSCVHHIQRLSFPISLGSRRVQYLQVTKGKGSRNIDYCCSAQWAWSQKIWFLSFFLSYCVLTFVNKLLESYQVALVVKNPLANAEDIRTWIQSLGQGDPSEEGMGTHSSILS